MSVAFPRCFNPVFPHLKPSRWPPFLPVILCLLVASYSFLLLCPLVFFSLCLPFFASVCSFSISSLCLFSTVLGRREQTSLKYQKTDQEAPLVPPPPSMNSPSLLLTDKQKREPAGLAAVYCLSPLPLALCFLPKRGRVVQWGQYLCMHISECVCPPLARTSLTQRMLLCLKQTTDSLGLMAV